MNLRHLRDRNERVKRERERARDKDKQRERLKREIAKKKERKEERQRDEILYVWLVASLTSSSTTRLYRGRAPRKSV